jgi:hypothetical protein
MVRDFSKYNFRFYVVKKLPLQNNMSTHSFRFAPTVNFEIAFLRILIRILFNPYVL